MPHAKGRRPKRQQPKRLSIQRKSPHMRRWLLQNPWMKPMVVFNYAATKLQSVVRMFINCRRVERRKGLRNSVVKARKILSRSQLDKYLSCMDKYNHFKRMKPKWLEDGYSSWCAVRIQAWWRMIPVLRRASYAKRSVFQIAALIIQSTLRNYFFRRKNKKLAVKAPARKFDIRLAVMSIQYCWRSYCNRRVFSYFKDLVINKLKGAPADLLKTIIPNEADLLDRAAGVHVRFRLGGSIFPPKVMFKVYTHRPLCDVNSFAPRDYSRERPMNNYKMFNNSSVTAPKGYDTIRVGASYFGTVVSTTVGSEHWYKRDEKNPWRPVSSLLINDLFAPPWLKDAQSSKVPAPFHFSSLKRKEDILKERRRRKREWMVKAYTMAQENDPKAAASGDIPDATWVSKKAEMYAHCRPAQPNGLNAISMTDSVTTAPYDMGRYPTVSQQPLPLPVQHRQHASDSLNRTVSRIDSKHQRLQFHSPLGEYEVDDAAGALDGLNPEDLVKWSMALDFDEYSREWKSLATSMPSSAAYGNMYKLAVGPVGSNAVVARSGARK